MKASTPKSRFLHCLTLSLLLAAPAYGREGDLQAIAIGTSCLGGWGAVSADMAVHGHTALALSADAALVGFLVRIMSHDSTEAAAKDKWAIGLFSYGIGVLGSYSVYSMFQGQLNRDEGRIYAGMAEVAILLAPVVFTSSKFDTRGRKPRRQSEPAVQPDPAIEPERAPEPFLESDHSLRLLPLPGGALVAFKALF